MRLFCFDCGKSVSSEIPDDVIIRAIATCPECIEKNKDKSPSTVEPKDFGPKEFTDE